MRRVHTTYLGLESARKAIGKLIEFEPDQAESEIVILISELEAYRFLCDQFVDKSDIRYQRLQLREAEYQKVMQRLRAVRNTVRAGGEAKECWEARLVIGARTGAPGPGGDSKTATEPGVPEGGRIAHIPSGCWDFHPDLNAVDELVGAPSAGPHRDSLTVPEKDGLIASLYLSGNDRISAFHLDL